MNKIKQWLRRWLGVDGLDGQLYKLHQAMVENDERFHDLFRTHDKRLGKVEDIIGKTIRAGFDHHVRQPSWIVLAWREKNGREHVHFYEVDKEHISEFNDMLNSFKRENVIIDTHPQIFPQFKW